MAHQTIPLTREGYRKIENDLNYLRNVRLSEVAARLREARSEGGDPAENTELSEAGREFLHVQSQIDKLTAQLGMARIIDEGDIEHGVVGLLSTVTIQEEGFEPETYQIVGSVEADPREGRLSADSPLGKALMGKQAGETVTIKAPDGSFEVRIIDVS